MLAPPEAKQRSWFRSSGILEMFDDSAWTLKVIVLTCLELLF